MIWGIVIFAGFTSVFGCLTYFFTSAGVVDSLVWGAIWTAILVAIETALLKLGVRP